MATCCNQLPDQYNGCYADLVGVLSSSNELVSSCTDKLYSANFVDIETKNKLRTVTQMSAGDRARLLLDSIKLDSKDKLKELCSILLDVSDVNFQSITERMERSKESMYKVSLSSSVTNPICSDNNQTSESLQRALSNHFEPDIPESADTLDLNNHLWKVFNKYHDDLVDAIISISDAQSVVDDLAEKLSAQQVISLAKYDALKGIDDIGIRVKSMFDDVGINVQRRRKENDPFAKFLKVIKVISNERLSKILDDLRSETYPVSAHVSIPQADQRQCLNSRISRVEESDIIQCLETPCTPAIEGYKKYLKARRNLKVKPDKKWPNLPYNQYVDLAVVTKDDANIDDFTSSTLHGNELEDIICKKEPISFDQFDKHAVYGSRLLMEGMPGIGKSTLALEFVKQWRDGKMFSSYNLMILLRLRNKKIQSAHDLIDNQSMKEKVYEEIEKEQGKGVFFILEGYDELPADIRSNESVLTELIDGKILPDATVLVTTRHSATKKLENLLEVEFDECFEVLGFSKDSINKYIESSSQTDEKSGLNKYLSRFPHIQGCLYIPLNLAFLVALFNDKRLTSSKPAALPETSTELYTSIIKCLLCRHLISQGKIKQLLEIEDLPTEDLKKFYKICEFAFDKLIDDQMTFDLPKDFDSLGLIDIEEYNDLSCGICTKSSFFHLTFQEYLAAYHISKLPDGEHQQLYDKLKSNSSFIVVLRFLAGLTGLRTININFPHEVPNFNCLQQLFESKNEAKIKEVLTGSIKIHRTWPPPVHQDLYALGRCIGLSECKWDLGFTFRGLKSDHVNMLSEGISSVKSPTGQINAIKVRLNPIGSHGVELLLNIVPEVLHKICILNLTGINLYSCQDLSIKLPFLTCLKTLLLHDNHIPYGGHIDLIKSISHSSSLQFVTFSKLSPEESSILLTKCTSLEKIELWQLPNESVQAVSTSINEAKGLLKLSLHESKLSSKNAQQLSSKLAENTNLKSLELVNCGLSDDAVHHIAEALAKNSTLKSLNLDNNLIRNDGGIALLQIQSSLVEVNLCRNPINICNELTSLLFNPHFKIFLSQKWKKELPSNEFLSFI